MDKKVAIVISTFNQQKLLELCLESLKKTAYENFEVFIVDDSGKGEIGKAIKEKFPEVDVTINNINLGFSKANNVGMRKALMGNPDYILLLNDDTEIIDPYWLHTLIEEGSKDNQIGILGCKLVYEDKTMQNIGGYMRKWEITKEINDRNDVFEVDHVMGAFLMIKKEVIEKIGLLNECYTPYLLEDTDYCLTAKRAGFKCISVGNIITIHKKGKTINSLPKNNKAMFIRFKNDIMFSWRNLKLMDALFRIFVYLPMVALFKKKNDEASLEAKNFRLKPNCLTNVFLLIGAFFLVILGLNFIYKNRK